MEAWLVYPLRLERHARKLAEELERRGVEAALSPLEKTTELGAGLVVALGLDREVLDALHRVRYGATVVPVAPPAYAGYVAMVPFERGAHAAAEAASGRANTARVPVLEAVVDGGKALRAVNEVAVFPRRSATLMEYSLSVDGDLLWRDSADGVIVSTPLGSTAYALSAGGPAVLLNAEVLVVVPVNSTEPGRRPLVVSQRSAVKVSEIYSTVAVEAVADGLDRVEAEEEVEVRVGGHVNLVTAEDRGTVLAKRKLSFEDLKGLPPSAKFILKVLEEGEMGVSEIIEATGLPERTVRYALSLLSSRGLVEKVEDPVNPRRILYRPRSARPGG